MIRVELLVLKQVMLQGTGDAAPQIGNWRLACSAAGSGANQGLAGLECRTAEGLGLLSKTCCWRRDGEAREANLRPAHTHPTGGRMARSLTRREDWTRDAVGVRWPGGESPKCPRYG